jgi:AraC family transcriptional regulator
MTSPGSITDHSGKVIRHGRFGSFSLAEIRHPPGVRLPTHVHELSCFSLILSGGFQESFGRTSYDCLQGSVLFRPSLSPHTDIFGPSGARAFLLEVDREWIESTQQRATTLTAPNQARVHSATSHIAMRVFREWRNADSVAGLMIDGLVLEMAAQLQRARLQSFRHEPPWLNRVKQLLDDCFLQPPSLSELASVAMVHPTHVIRQFRNRYHCTPGEYARELRLRYACELLARTRMRLLEVAEASGFSDQAHFSRTFHRLMGITPTEYRTGFRSSAR